MIDTPSQSLDWKPIENMWDYLNQKVYKNLVFSIPEFKKSLIEKCNKISSWFIQCQDV